MLPGCCPQGRGAARGPANRLPPSPLDLVVAARFVDDGQPVEMIDDVRPFIAAASPVPPSARVSPPAPHLAASPTDLENRCFHLHLKLRCGRDRRPGWSAGIPFAAAGGSNVSMSGRPLGPEGAGTAGCERGRPSTWWPSCARAGRPRRTKIQWRLSTFSSQCVMRLGGTGAERGFLTPMRAEPQGQRCGPPHAQPWAVRRTGCAVGCFALAMWWAVWCACCRVGPILQLQLLLLTRCALWTGVL